MSIRRFVEEDGTPVASAFERPDQYPVDIVNRMAELGLCGMLIPEECGGLGQDSMSYAIVVEELRRGWMRPAGVINSHLIPTPKIWKFGTSSQQRYLPWLAKGECRGGLGLTTEADVGSDASTMRSVAKRDGDEYILNGPKMFVTNGERGNIVAILAKIDPAAQPRHRRISAFIVEKNTPSFRAGWKMKKLGSAGSTPVSYYSRRVGCRRIAASVPEGT